MNKIEQEATDAGISAGWDDANFVGGYGGSTPEESEIKVPAQYLQIATYYTAGYMQGAQDYEETDHDDEFVDPRENEWCGLNDPR